MSSRTPRHAERLSALPGISRPTARRAVVVHHLSGREVGRQNERLQNVGGDAKKERALHAALPQPEALCQVGHATDENTQGNIFHSESVVKAIYRLQHRPTQKSHKRLHKRFLQTDE